ncbi:MAG: PKD domain-containing protein [bacterium]|nr:PKD domain-containing protein [bacterium]
MRVPWTSPIILTTLLSILLVGCNSSSIYQNPISPTIDPTEWRSGTVDPSGGSFGFSDIGINLEFPAGAIPDDATFSFSVRGFPGDVPTTPAGPIYIRLGTFEMTGDDMVFQAPVVVSFQLAEYKSPGFAGRGFKINASYAWEAAGTAPVQNDGMHAVMSIDEPGIYGAFDPVPIEVEMIVSRQSGIAPMSIAFKAIVTGGTPPYDSVWYWGDNSDPGAGLVNSHFYKDPGDYEPSVLVMDAEGSSATDSVHICCYPHESP